MRPLPLPTGILPLDHRADQQRRFGRYAYDLVLSRWLCQGCGALVPVADPIAIPLITYRNPDSFVDHLTQAGLAAYQETNLTRCRTCGHRALLERLDQHAYLSCEDCDLVARLEPATADPASLWFWSRDNGYVRVIALSQEQSECFARDALLRSIGAHRDFDNVKEVAPLIEEALDFIPGEPQLLEFLPWLNARLKFSLAGPIAQAHIENHPDDPNGHYWLGQTYLQLVASGTAEPSLLEAAEAAFAHTLVLTADGYHADAELGLVNVSRARGDLATASARMELLLARHPDHPESLYTKGLMLLTTSPADALACFMRGAELRPDDPDYRRGLERARTLLAERQ